MQSLNKNDFVKIPILTESELIQLADIMHSNNKDELLEIRFWKEVYSKRGLNYKKGGWFDGSI